jgi:hypothetical protein
MGFSALLVFLRTISWPCFVCVCVPVSLLFVPIVISFPLLSLGFSAFVFLIHHFAW